MSTLRVFNHYVRFPFVLLGIIETCILFFSVFLGIILRFQGDFSEIGQTLSRYWLEGTIFGGVMILAMISAGLYQARLREGSFGFLLRLTAYHLE